MSFFDLNRDGEVDLADHFLAYNAFLSEDDEEQCESDMERDEYETDDDW